MTPVDRNLLLRVSRRIEERAEQDYRQACDDPRVSGQQELARRRRDRELGDAKDLRDFVRRFGAETK